MGVSVRSYLTAGAAAATATVVALGPLQVTPPDIAVPAQPGATQPHLSQALLDLLASARQMQAALPAPKAPLHTAAPAVGVTPTAAVTADSGEVGVQNAASDFVTSTYQYIQGWVDWGVNYGVDIAYWLGGWGVPFAGLIGAQTDILYYQLIRPIADSVVYDLIDPVLNAPLNLGVWANGIGNVAYSVVANAINTGVAELNYFFGWVLPPLPPPFPISLTAAETSALSAASLPVESLTNVLTAARTNLTDAVENVTDTSLAALFTLSTDTAEETTETTDITETTVAGDTTDSSDTGDATDPVDRLATVRANVHDAFDDVSQFVKTGLEQVAEIPGSVRESLAPSADVTVDPDLVVKADTKSEDVKPEDTKPQGTKRAARTSTDRATQVRADVKKATDGVRSAVRDVRKALSGKKSDTTAGEGTSADATKVGKKDRRKAHAKPGSADSGAKDAGAKDAGAKDNSAKDSAAK